jgi:hypothetical protein
MNDESLNPKNNFFSKRSFGLEKMMKIISCRREDNGVKILMFWRGNGIGRFNQGIY